MFCPTSDCCGPSSHATNCRILVADDRREIQYLIQHFLQDAGAQVTLAKDGWAALEAIERSRSLDDEIDLIIMDIQMPGLDGYETTQRLRARGFSKPILALTAGAMQGDRLKCLEAGCNGFLSKPIDREILIKVVASYTSTSADRLAAPRRLQRSRQAGAQGAGRG